MSRDIAVIIPSKERPGCASRHVRVFREFSEDIELVVVRDGRGSECDQYREIEGKLKGIEGAKYIECEESRGAGAARNTGAASVGDVGYVWFVDDDDDVPSETVESVLRGCESMEERVLLLPSELMEGGDRLSVRRVRTEGSVAQLVCRGQVDVNTSCMVIPVEAFREVGGWDASLVAGQDTDLMLRLSRVVEFTVIETAPVGIDVGRADRITRDWRAQVVGKWQFLRKHHRRLHWKRVAYYVVTLVTIWPLWKTMVPGLEKLTRRLRRLGNEVG